MNGSAVIYYSDAQHQDLHSFPTRRSSDLNPETHLEILDAFAGNTALRVEVAEAYQDRKSTRLNSSHGYTSYAVSCLKTKGHTWSFMELRTVGAGVPRSPHRTDCRPTHCFA